MGWVAFAWVLAVFGITLFRHRAKRQEWRRAVRERGSLLDRISALEVRIRYAARNQGRCLACRDHRYDRSHGDLSDITPHACPEGNE